MDASEDEVTYGACPTCGGSMRWCPDGCRQRAELAPTLMQLRGPCRPVYGPHPLEIRTCNCSECGAEIQSMWEGNRRVSIEPDMHNRRIICSKCTVKYPPPEKKASWAIGARGMPERDPSHDNAIRAMEGD